MEYTAAVPQYGDQGQDALAAYRAAHGGKNPPKTSGERIVNLLNDYGLGWLVNSAVSVHLADAGEFGYGKKTRERVVDAMANRRPFNKTGAMLSQEDLSQAHELYEHLIQHNEYKHLHEEVTQLGGGAGEFFERMGEPTQAILQEMKQEGVLKGKQLLEEFNLLKTAKIGHHHAHTMLSFALLTLGGWLVMPLMKAVSDHKGQMIGALDNLMHRHPSEAEQQAVSARHEYLQQEPKKTWLGESFSRLATTLSVIGIFYHTAHKNNILAKAGLKEFEGIEHHAEQVAEVAHRGLKNMELTKGLTGKAERFLADEAKGIDGSKRLSKILEFLAIDSFFSLIFAGLAAGFSRAFSSLLGKREEEMPSASSLYAAAPVSPAPIAVSSSSSPAPEQLKVMQQAQSHVRDAVPAGVLVAPEVTQNLSMHV